MGNRKLFGIVALLAALTLVGAACSKSKAKEVAGPAQCKSDHFGCVEYKTGEPINVATLLSISGATAFLGQDSQRGVALALDNLDGTLDGKLGMLLGHQVLLGPNLDDLCSKQGGQSGATRLAADPTIVAVIGTSCSSSALGVADNILGAKGIVLFSPSNTNPALTAQGTHQPFYMRTAHNDLIQGAVVADFAFKMLGVKTAATIHDESPYADALASVFRTDFQKLGGTITPNGDQAVQSTDTDFKTLLTTIGQDHPELVYYPDFDPACALIAKQAREVPDLANTQLMGSDGCLESAYIKTGGSAVDGTYVSGPDFTGLKKTSPFYADKFLTAYHKEFGTAPTASFHAHAFDATNILFEAIRKVAIDAQGNAIPASSPATSPASSPSTSPASSPSTSPAPSPTPGPTIYIPRSALKDAIFATSNYQGLIGTVTCTPLGDCATQVTIGVYRTGTPGLPVEGGNPNAEPVFEETKTLAEASAG
jgi:branched-chain amino acid transport system substrate-binding protein